MQNTVFIINDRFLVEIERSELLDKATGEKKRLEPRLIKLLHLLIEHQGKIVKREYIIKEIWDDYPGANEGLSQAISFLRKLLADEYKVIIQTQPKVGYNLNAIVSQVNKRHFSFRKKQVPLILSAFVLLLLLFFGVNIYLQKNELPTDNRQLYKKNNVEISRRDSIHQSMKIKRLLKDTLGQAAKGDSLRTN